MEIEKPFKCSVCSAHFTNEGHLEVHKKRHVMSLNLFKPGNLSSTNGPDGFVDETPTPTRFITTCEEVGLFQDLQNVNPFDLQFKAASSTPSTECFEFNFSTSKRGINSDDTLNTPQVNLGFGYTPVPTPIASVQNSGISTTTSSSSDLEVVQKAEESDVSVVGRTEETERDIRVESTTPDNDSLTPPLFTSDDTNISKSRHKKLKLNLTPVEKNSDDVLSESILSSADIQNEFLYYEEDEDDVLKSVSVGSKKSKKGKETQCKKKTELLERNRAAASRSRERRKQWVSMLETRCQTLETALSQAQSEVTKLRAENTLLRQEIGKHINCDVTRAEPSQDKIKNLSNGSLSLVKHSTPTVSQQCSHSTATMKPPPVIPVKTKRGRPRKGSEKRVVDICIPLSSSPKPPALPLPPIRIPVRNEAPIKVEMLPLKCVDGQQLPNIYVLKRGS